jgi:Protein of unknown function (DUF3037)
VTSSSIGCGRRGASSKGRRVPAEYTYDYAIIRVVPRVERGERINVGVILSCADVEFLDARIELDVPRLLALDPTVDVETMRNNLATIPAVCRGGEEAGLVERVVKRPSDFRLPTSDFRLLNSDF